MWMVEDYYYYYYYALIIEIIIIISHKILEVARLFLLRYNNLARNTLIPIRRFVPATTSRIRKYSVVLYTLSDLGLYNYWIIF